MKSDIAGNMISDVRGLSEVKAATAKELKATSTEEGINYYSARYEEDPHTGDASPQSHIEGL